MSSFNPYKVKMVERIFQIKKSVRVDSNVAVLTDQRLFVLAEGHEGALTLVSIHVKKLNCWARVNDQTISEKLVFLFISFQIKNTEISTEEPLRHLFTFHFHK